MKSLPSKRALGAALVLIAVLAGLVIFRDFAKDAVVQIIGEDMRDDLVAAYSSATVRVPDTADMTAMPNTGLNPFGVNVFLEQEVEESQIRRTLQMVKDAGFGWIKQQVLWSEIEIPSKGKYVDEKNGVADTWAKYDRIVNLANEYGLQVIARLDTSPAWAIRGTTKIETPPANYDDYGDFVYNIVRRYRGRVKYYQIWNEPNTAFEWGNQRVNPVDYVRLLKTAYIRAKQADPNAVILAAALAPTIEDSDRAMNDVVFLQKMYDAGAKNYFDIMSANPYGLRSGPYDRRLDEDKDVNFSRPILIREVMVRNGDASKPMWGSEMGWNALPLDYPQEPMFGRVTPEQQARYTVKGYQRILEEWPWMGVVNLWHFRRVHPVNQNEQMYYFSLVDQDFTPNPVYNAMKQFTKSERLVYRGYHQEDHWALDYKGNWRTVQDMNASLGSYRATETAGDEVKFTFMGDKLSLVVPRSPQGGRLRIVVDGVPPNLLPKNSNGKAYVDLRSEVEAWQQIVPVASGLAYGRHTVDIVTVPQREPTADTRWYFDAFIVDGKPANRGVLVFLLGSSIAGILVGLLAARVAGARLAVLRS
ncbi:MAG: hypothetical protein M0T85_17125 [Dehalococcoidales bacterium]|nr:hypothetical protein [Dehalococcoidales bacterium]